MFIDLNFNVLLINYHSVIVESFRAKDHLEQFLFKLYITSVFVEKKYILLYVLKSTPN